jgi:hypothetical protein
MFRTAQFQTQHRIVIYNRRFFRILRLFFVFTNHILNKNHLNYSMIYFLSITLGLSISRFLFNFFQPGNQSLFPNFHTGEIFLFLKSPFLSDKDYLFPKYLNK